MRPIKSLVDYPPRPVEPVHRNPVQLINTLPQNDGAKHIPGYAGYVPTIRFDQGRTFPDLTEKYYRLHRNTEIGRVPPEERGWYIPRDDNPKQECVKGLLDNMDKQGYTTSQSHIMYNVDAIRERNTNEFYNAAQTHRNILKHNYNAGQKVKHFDVPVSGPHYFTD